MIDADKPMFGKRISRMAIVFKEDMSSERMRCYWEILSVLSKEEFERACDHIEKTGTWFPKPAQFIHAARTVGWI